MIVAGMKQCCRCREMVPVGGFYKSRNLRDGLKGECKRCSRAWCQANRSRIADYMRERKIRMRDHLKEKKRSWRLANKDKVTARSRRIRASKPLMAKAHGAVQRAVESGSLVRLGCELCGEPRANAHHRDYARPLDVLWLCPVHHSEVHELEAIDAK